MKEFNIVLIGVGGQGVLTLGRIISQSALKQGYDVRTTELHGLAQRGGSIPFHVRFGKKMYTPLVSESEADLIIALEPLEALRACYYGSREQETTFLIDKYFLPPLSVSVLGERYPPIKEIVKILKGFSKKIIILNASDVVRKQTGNVFTLNVFMLGYSVGNGLIPLKEKYVLKGIEETVPEKYIEINKRVFELGMKHK